MPIFMMFMRFSRCLYQNVSLKYLRNYRLIVTKSNLINLYRYNGRRNSPSIRSYMATLFTMSEVSLMRQTKY